MHTTALLSTHATTRGHWLVRALEAFTEAAAAARLGWHQRRQLDREHRERMLLAELDPRVLSDIGAPDWMEAEAGARRAACNYEREQLRIGGAAIDTRYW